MVLFRTLCTAAALGIFAPVAASASTLLESKAVFFGISKTEGQIISGSGGSGFRENIHFTNDLSLFNIDRFEITVNVAGVDPAPAGGFSVFDPNQPIGPDNIGGLAADGADETPDTEIWFVEIVGKGNGSSNQAFWKRLLPDGSAITPISLSALNDGSEFGADRVDGVANNAFDRSINQNQISIRFRERSGGTDDQFELFSIKVDVYEVSSQEPPPAPVPVPASGLLLLGAVGGVAAWKRRKAAS